MLIGAIALGLVLGLLAGGNIWNLGLVRLRWIGVLLLAVVVRFGTEALIERGFEPAEQFRLLLFGGAYAPLLVGLWANRAHPGMSLAFVGILCNLIAITLNNGRMPIWEPSLLAAGLSLDDARTVFHTLLPAALDADFLRRGGPFADVIPIPIPFLRNVASVGDLFLASGLAFFLFATALRTPAEAARAPSGLTYTTLGMLALSSVCTISLIEMSRPPGVSRVMMTRSNPSLSASANASSM